MDIQSNETKHPSLVEVVNKDNAPIKADILNLPLTQISGENFVLVRVGGSVQVQSFRPLYGNFNVYLDNILLLQGDGTFVPIPLNTFFSNITQIQLNNALDSYKTAYATLVSGVTAATLHYSKITNTGLATSEVYDLKD